MSRIKNWILSASGWRTTFGSNRWDNSENISDELKYLSRLCAYEIATADLYTDVILVAHDARPTGKAIADQVIRTLITLGRKVVYTGITAAPEAFNYSYNFDAFIYISASHNPVGDNGFKFGADGGVFSASIINPIIEYFKEDADNKKLEKGLNYLVDEVNEKEVKKVYRNQEKHKHKSYISYFESILDNNRIIKEDVQLIADYGLSIAADFNGSARSTSIDKELLDILHINSHFENNRAGLDIVHEIVPEGENLNLCAKILKRENEKDSTFLFSYMPDNDGDRGNFVYLDDNKNPIIIESQQLFSLMILASLYNDRLIHPRKRIAICVNGPTSNRIDEIAKVYKAQVFRAEVGEANVVTLANEKRKEGFLANIMGEGSNGGNISYPSKVRDPLYTLIALARLISNPRIINDYRKRINLKELPAPISFSDILKSLPTYTTTGAYDDLAKMQLKNELVDFKGFLSRYLDEFKNQWPSIKKDFNLLSYKHIQYKGVDTLVDQDLSDIKCGSKIELYDNEDDLVAWIWMRASGTEPVFRVCCDVKGDNLDLEQKLLGLHRNIIEKSDC